MKPIATYVQKSNFETDYFTVTLKSYVSGTDLTLNSYVSDLLWKDEQTTTTYDKLRLSFPYAESCIESCIEPYTKSYTEYTEYTESYNTYHKFSFNGDYWVTPQVNPLDRLREIIRNRQAPIIITRSGVAHPIDDREFRARDTLRRIIGERVYQIFLKRGFVSVRAKSGRVYQIFPGHKSTVCWENGKRIKTMCVVLRGGFAPTDELIMRYILITTDEQDFWHRANVGDAYPHNQPQEMLDLRPLPEILAELKAA